MSLTLFLDTLRKYGLQQYYPGLYSHGMSTLNSLAELSMEDCTKVGVRSIDDKRKFMALADDLKQQSRTKSTATTRSSNSNSNNNNAMATTSPHQSRKRPFKNEKTPPEKHPRRMTLSQQTLPRTSTSPK
ncbi:hypothetical protein BDC45DRAFT_490181, partial [Circinella umbellata]